MLIMPSKFFLPLWGLRLLNLTKIRRRFKESEENQEMSKTLELPSS